MALVLKDRVKETTTTTGTGTITLAGAVSGFQSFSTIGNANTTYYAIIGDTEWEIGIGTYTSSGTTLSRDTVLASSNSGSLVSFSAGTKTVFCDYPATKSVSTDSLATPPAIGATTPAAGTFTTLIGGGGSANYGQLTGGATTKAVEFKTIGSDTNVALALLSQGTGAIDLAAGSRGVNISNGGTVTAITRTALGVNYTSPPSVAISAPTTVGGVQSTATVELTLQTTTGIVTAGGSGYAVGDTFTVNGGTFSAQLRLQVLTVSGGAVTSVSSLNGGSYSVIPSTPATTTNIIGTGTGCTITPIWGVNSTFTITNAGSGYVEQPTVSFSGGGGSGATAYATVGSGTVIRGLGSSTITGTTLASIIFQTPNTLTPAFVIRDTSTSADTYLAVTPNASYVNVFPQGNANAILKLGSNGTGSVYLNTQGSSETNQMRVSHTASAVNYVQVTGAATTGSVALSSQGSDTNVSLNLITKGTGVIRFYTAAASSEQFRVTHTAGTIVNYATVTGNIAGSSPTFSVAGSDTDIDLTLTPKGAGAVRFGTYTASVLTPTGYITIKDSGGTTRRLLVG